MTRAEQLKYCQICLNRTFSKQEGIICKLTNQKADFKTQCTTFEKDVDAYYHQKLFEMRRQESHIPKDYVCGLEKYGIKNGIVAGIVLLIIGIGWLVIGLKYNFIFWYPLILIIVGLFVLGGGIFNAIIRQKIKKNSQQIMFNDDEILDDI